ncbi:hypothetical protein N0M98_17910 [Paenibacillus doosanensis]|uniref:DNA-binding transcriptional activator FeaR n=1 Tax=Paenibacillus konkukensis TaxID=2020716 RepID=A0ABY4RU89_9BACL|nr:MULTISPECIES: hypothetical protein [Paenibacillus]MCS7462017.1 hypothetical protein [Paenibacillus doosanensis]UQZ85078.1 DNA-binding transcriptional activator FeaR [Paenibacillus konkukensis]
MPVPVYRFQVDYLTRYCEFNPQLLFVQKYMFAPGEQCPSRTCCANAVVLIVTELAGKYGFSSIHYFSTAFKRSAGMSPFEYREQYCSPPKPQKAGFPEGNRLLPCLRTAGLA